MSERDDAYRDLESMWDFFRSTALPPNVHSSQLSQMQSAFCAGAMMTIDGAAHQRNESGPIACNMWMDRLHLKLDEYFQSLHDGSDDE